MHGSAIVLGDRCLLIVGGSGSGKTTLALALIACSRQAGRFARLISDDQVLLTARAGRIVCTAPLAIGGLVEVRGVGPRPIGFEPSAVVDLLVRLIPAGEAERFPEEATEIVAGCAIPRLGLAERNVTGAIAAVAARLSLPPFVANAQRLRPECGKMAENTAILGLSTPAASTR